MVGAGLHEVPDVQNAEREPPTSNGNVDEMECDHRGMVTCNDNSIIISF
jgi:hypothetical protein